MAEDQFAYPNQPRLSKEQKTGFVLLVIFAILAIGLGLLQIRNGLYAPFALNNTVPLSLKNDINSPDALRFRDTDHDSLTDFDELYVYGTSPYLYDTFSYGLSDKEVVTKNLALCPKGQCADPTAGFAVSSTSVVAGDNANLLLPVANNVDPGTPQDLNAMLNDPAQLRQMLSDSGVSPDILKKLSDSQLLQMVTEILANTSSTSLPTADAARP